MAAGSKTLHGLKLLRECNLWCHGDENLYQPAIGDSSEGLARIRKELERLEREKLVLLKLIGPTTVLTPDAGRVPVGALAGRDEAVRSLLEVERKIKRSLDGLARREIDLK